MKTNQKLNKFFSVLLTLALLLAVLPAGSVLADDPHIITVTNISGLQNALDHSANNYPNGSIVQVSNGGTWEGNLKINQPIIFRTTSGQPPFTIKGQLEINYEGDDALLIQNIIFEADPEFEHDNVVISKGKNITIEDCVFDGKDPDFHPSISTHRAVQMSKNAENILIDNCKFKDGYYVTIQGYAKGLTVKGSTINNVKSGINHQGGGDLTVEDCEITNKPVESGNSYGLRYTAEKNENTKLTITESIFNIELSDPPIAPGPDKIHASIITRGDGIDILEAYENQIYGKVVNSTPTTFQAINNYWGSPCGPDSDKIEGSVAYSPWYIDEDMTTLSDYTEYTFPTELSTAEINATIACAAPYTKFNFDGAYSVDGIKIPEDRNNLHFFLKDGTVIESTRYCFAISGDYIRIEAESFAGAKCVYATGETANGIFINPYYQGEETLPLVDFVLEKVEIDGSKAARPAAAVSISAFDVKDIHILNNYIHDLYYEGNGYSYAMQVDGKVDGEFIIKGNLFKNTGGIMDGSLGLEPFIDATYNSWGAYNVTRDMVDSWYVESIGWETIEFDPWTHADLSVEYASGTPWDRQVEVGEEVKYVVKGNFKQITGAIVALPIPEELEIVSYGENDVFGFELISEKDNVIYFDGAVVSSGTGPIQPLPDGKYELFSVTLKAEVPGKYNLAVDTSKAKFSMFPPGEPAPSNWVYLNEAHAAELNAIALPTLEIDPEVGPYQATVPIEFDVNVDNEDGGNFDELELRFELPNDAKLEYWDGTEWKEVVNGVYEPDTLAPDAVDFDPELPQFRVTFNDLGEKEITVTLYDTSTTEPTELAMASHTFTLEGVTITGTFSMQGRTTRAGIPVTIGDETQSTNSRISNNLVLTGFAGGPYFITTNQDRYLNVTEDLAKQILIAGGNYTLPPLELKGGNVKNDGDSKDVVDLGDASMVGSAYGKTTTEALKADANFDGVVNIYDLALVGGNYNLTSQVAYALWLP